MPAGHPPIGDSPSEAAPAPTAFDPQSVISGVLRLDDKVKAQVAAGDTIFLVARAADAAGAPGPILAVKKLSAGGWPLAFSLDGRDAMTAGTKLAGKVIVSVRVDKDGDALTKNAGDVTGVSRPLDVPAQKVVITLDTTL
jgi:cytochrome c-type biogenesis protein CcmH